MPHIHSSTSQVKRGGQKAFHDIKRSSPQAIPRDDLRTAFAGDQNRGPAGKVSKSSRGTHNKSRRLRRGDGKQPVR